MGGVYKNIVAEISPINLSVLVHTFEGYKHLWDGFLKSSELWANDWHNCFGIDLYFGTDVNNGWRAPAPWKTIHSGLGQWSDRLDMLVSRIPTDYIFYVQEDHYAYRKPFDLSELHELMQLISANDLKRVQISTVNQYYTLKGAYPLLYFQRQSKYLVSHQPSIWEKSFLLNCLKSDESPWDNEYKGTLRVSRMPEVIGKIAIYPTDWYDHVCIKGKVIERSVR